MTRTAAQTVPAIEIHVGDLVRGSDATGERFWHEVTAAAVRTVSPGRRYVRVAFADRRPVDFPEDFLAIVRRAVA